MTERDLSAGRLQPLTINAGGGLTFDIRPTADDMRRMGLFVAAAEAGIRVGVKSDDSVESLRDRLDPDDYDLLDSNESLARVQLGSTMYDRMVAGGIPLPDVYMFGQYSMNYHTKGAAFADRVLELTMEQKPADDVESAATFPKPSKSGRSTASESRARTARTAATASSRRTSGKTSTSSKK